MLKREIKTTRDGSNTLYIPEWNESYHSKHGALQEAQHVFIKNGLNHFGQSKNLRALEFGFGTGLNTMLTLLFAVEHKIPVDYTTLEKFPINQDEIQAMAIDSLLKEKLELPADLHLSEIYRQMHTAPWDKLIRINSYFNLKKIKIDFRDFKDTSNSYDVVFYDAFGMRVQPELWDEKIFIKIHDALAPNGLLTTYAANGKTKRALQACGFEVQKLPGPPGKREMINAWKK